MRLMGVLVLMLVALVAPAGAATDVVKDPDGNTLAVVVDCNSCQNPSAKGGEVRDRRRERLSRRQAVRQMPP